jgi:hypothetical protein
MAGGQLYESGEDDRCFWNDATASSSLAYTIMTVSSFVRRSNSVKPILEETSLAPLSGSLFCVKRCTRAAKPVLSGECGTTFVATPKLAKTLKNDLLLPPENTATRRSLDFWLDSQGIRPVITGEFQDYALLRAFGQAGRGIFPIPSVFEKQLRQDSLQRIGRNRFYAISVERKLKHPAVIAICDTARQQLFSREAVPAS